MKFWVEKIGALVLVVVSVLIFTSSWYRLDKTLMAEQQCLGCSLLLPGTKVDVADIYPCHIEMDRNSLYLRNVCEQKNQDSACGELLEDAYCVINREIFFMLGADKYGRDILSRLLLGGQISLSVGFFGVLISLFVGTFLGVIAGFYGGFLDKTVMYFAKILWGIPSVLMALLITLILGKGLFSLSIAIGLSLWIEVARQVRGMILSYKEKDFIKAAHSMGFSDWRIIIMHLLPNLMNILIILSTVNFTSAILLESGISFLGLGVAEPMPSWGGMIRENKVYLLSSYSYLVLFPAMMIVTVVLCFTLITGYLKTKLNYHK